MIRRDDSTPTGANITLEGGAVVTLDYTAGIQFPPGSANAIAFIEALLNSHPANETRIRLRDLPADDPDKTTNPNREGLFWSDPRGRPNDELVGRSSIYTVTWDGGRYQYSSHRAR